VLLLRVVRKGRHLRSETHNRFCLCESLALEKGLLNENWGGEVAPIFPAKRGEKVTSPALLRGKRRTGFVVPTVRKKRFQDFDREENVGKGALLPDKKKKTREPRTESGPGHLED